MFWDLYVVCIMYCIVWAVPATRHQIMPSFGESDCHYLATYQHRLQLHTIVRLSPGSGAWLTKRRAGP